MADFSFLSDTDESAVEQILAEAMDHCVLQQVAAINCSSFSHSVLPSNLESRFQRLKTFPSSSASSSNPSKPVPKPQLGPNSANELKNSVTELKDEKPISDDFVKTPEKTPEKEKKSDRKSGSGYLSSSGSSNSSSGYLNSPNNRGKQGVKKGKDGNFSSGSSNSGLKASTKSVKTGCFWCSPKRVSRKKSDGGGSTRNRAFELGDDWGKHDEILSDLRSFSAKKQKNLMKIAKKEEEKINKEAEKIVKWAKQTSARLDFSINDDLSDDDSDYSFGHH
ncbi:uncharacterized protein LOC110696537 [Chenopodium quinoa]|uniref:uncharacterized protein LOC110696537 n=1 Tax=Chenopodium quinoa TaxID=63459 RepID=UPI000B782A8E|nr:uncharacterized protein LOC110696537 [Chenopodium quinoa]